MYYSQQLDLIIHAHCYYTIMFFCVKANIKVTINILHDFASEFDVKESTLVSMYETAFRELRKRDNDLGIIVFIC